MLQVCATRSVRDCDAEPMQRYHTPLPLRAARMNTRTHARTDTSVVDGGETHTPGPSLDRQNERAVDAILRCEFFLFLFPRVTGCSDVQTV